MTVDTLSQVLGPLGALALALFLVASFMRGTLVSRATYRDMVQDRDDWKDIALRNADAADRAVSVVEVKRRRRRVET